MIGEVGLDNNTTAKYTYSARARDHMTVIKLTEEAFMRALMQQYTEGQSQEEEALYSMKVGTGQLPPPLSLLCVYVHMRLL